MSQSKIPLSKEEALDELIDFHLLVDEARRRGYAKNRTVLAEFKKALVLAYLEKAAESITAETIPVEEVKERYEQQQGRFVHGILRDVRHMLILTGKDGATDAEARIISADVSRQLQGAETDEAFQKGVAEATKGMENIKVEDLPPFAEDSRRFVKPFVAGTFAVDYPRRKVSAPVKTSYGYHVIFIQSETPALNVPFNEARKTIAEEMVEPRRQEYILKLIDSTYEKGEVFIYDAVLENTIGVGDTN